MRGKSIRDISLKGLPAVVIVAIAAIFVGFVGFFGRFLSKPAESGVVVETVGRSAERVQTLADIKGSEDVIPPPPAKSPKASTVAAPTDIKAIATRQGVLRVSNPTDHPIRVAILLRKNLTTATNAPAAYEPPAHWDFDPGEGSTKGLLLSLPNRRIKLKKGDVLVAFAQDGSRRYWGPYVVGETQTPAWISKTAEWQLTLEQ